MLRPDPYLPFPSIDQKADFPTRGESVPVLKTILLLEHQAFERRESEDRMRESVWIPPSAPVGHGPGCTVNQLVLDARFCPSPAATAGKVPLLNSDTAIARNANVVRFRFRLPSPNGFLHAPRLASGLTNKVCQQ